MTDKEESKPPSVAPSRAPSVYGGSVKSSPLRGDQNQSDNKSIAGSVKTSPTRGALDQNKSDNKSVAGSVRSSPNRGQSDNKSLSGSKTDSPQKTDSTKKESTPVTESSVKSEKPKLKPPSGKYVSNLTLSLLCSNLFGYTSYYRSNCIQISKQLSIFYRFFLHNSGWLKPTYENVSFYSRLSHFDFAFCSISS